MKLLLFTDLHANPKAISILLEKAKKEKPDYLICTGDISVFGTKLEEVIRKFKPLNIPFILIPGNHEEGLAMKEVCSKYSFVIYLHKRILVKEDYLFFGYGGGGFCLVDSKFEDFTKKLENQFEGKKVIFLAHAPFYGTNLDVLFEGDRHRGNTSFTQFIKKIKPVLAVCGHFHECFGKKDKIGKTLVINPGQRGALLELP